MHRKDKNIKRMEEWNKKTNSEKIEYIKLTGDIEKLGHQGSFILLLGMMIIILGASFTLLPTILGGIVICTLAVFAMFMKLYFENKYNKEFFKL